MNNTTAEPLATCSQGSREAVRRCVVEGLSRTPKSLPPWLLYDETGSQLFERITELPEYYLTRLEKRLLAQHTATIIAHLLPKEAPTLVEVGAGTATKTRVLLRAALQKHRTVSFVPIDVSRQALDILIQDISRELPGVQTTPLCVGNVEGLLSLRARESRAVLCLGSSIGNLEDADAVALLRAARQAAGPRGHLLLGADRLKPIEVMVRAYNDAQGVTEAFNKNVLARINRDLGGDFDLEAFAHVAEWDADQGCIAIYLEEQEEPGCLCARSGSLVFLSAG